MDTNETPAPVVVAEHGGVATSGTDVVAPAEIVPVARDKSAEIKAIIDQWHGESFRGTAVSRDVEVWNIVFNATESLKDKLAAVFKEA